jgi:octaprenyl-diphosphate synthase
MEEVDHVISKRLSSDVPLVGEVAKYIISAGGKRIRPALLLLFSGALSYTHHNKYEMAAVVEIYPHCHLACTMMSLMIQH